jgi:hypothetical protein
MKCRISRLIFQYIQTEWCRLSDLEIFDKRKDGLTSEEICENNVGSISCLIWHSNISIVKEIQSRSARRKVIDRGDGHEHGPGNQPDRQKNANHHPQESYKKVCVRSIDLLNIVIVCFEQGDGPSQKPSLERFDTVSGSKKRVKWLGRVGR